MSFKDLSNLSFSDRFNIVKEEYRESLYTETNSNNQDNILKDNILKDNISDIPENMNEGTEEVDLLSIVLDDIDSEKKVAEAVGEADDIFGLKEFYAKKEIESKKGKMREKDLKSMTERRYDAEFKTEKNSEFASKIEYLSAGIANIWSQDSEYQRDILEVFMREIRKIPEEYLKDYVDRLVAVGGFFNPNEDYLEIAFGKEICNPKYGIFDDSGYSRYLLRLMMPLRFLDGSVVGFVGYSPVNNEEGRSIKYLYPRKEVLEKSRLIATEPEVFRKALKDGYICLTDGYFDAFSLNVYGINAASLCGSAVTKYHKLLLSKIPKKIIIPDNDKAGTKLESTIKRIWNKSGAIHQTEAKDIDEWLLNSNNIIKLQNEFNNWRELGFIGDLNI